MAHAGAVQGEVDVFLPGLGQEEVPDLLQDLPQAAGGLLRPGLLGVHPGEGEHLVDEVQELAAGVLDPVEVALHRPPALRAAPGQAVPGQGGEAEDGVEGSAHIVGHIGEEGILGADGGVGLVQGLLQDLLLLQLPAELLVHPATPQNQLPGPVPLAHVDEAQLEILGLPAVQHPVVDAVGGLLRQAAAGVVRLRLPDHPLPVVRVDPPEDVLLEALGVVQGAAGGNEEVLRAGAEAVGEDLVLLQVRVEDGVVAGPQALDDLQLAVVLPVHAVPLPVALLLLPEKVFPLPPAALRLLRGVGQKDVEHIPHGLAADEVAVVLDPAQCAVPPDDPVFHIVQVELTGGDLTADALLHLLQVLRMHHAAEGSPGQRHELLGTLALEDPQQPSVGVEDLLPAPGPVDEETPGHLLHKLHQPPGRLQLLPVPGVPQQLQNLLDYPVLSFLHSVSPFTAVGSIFAILPHFEPDVICFCPKPPQKVLQKRVLYAVGAQRRRPVFTGLLLIPLMVLRADPAP